MTGLIGKTSVNSKTYIAENLIKYKINISPVLRDSLAPSMD